jgi:hypothetical protein
VVKHGSAFFRGERILYNFASAVGFSFGCRVIVGIVFEDKVCVSFETHIHGIGLNFTKIL